MTDESDDCPGDDCTDDHCDRCDACGSTEEMLDCDGCGSTHCGGCDDDDCSEEDE